MTWGESPIIKIYEAVGAVADGRVDVSGNTAKVYSSSRNKYYDVTYDPDTYAIMANDNGSYWKGYLGYPSIAFLLATGVLPYDAALGKHLKGIAWKDLNKKFNDDYDKTLAHIRSTLKPAAREALAEYIQELDGAIAMLDLQMLGKKQKPPEGY